MKRQPGIEKKVEDAMSSLDGIERAAPGNWFYTRIRAKLERDENTVWTSIGTFLSRPVVAFATLGLIVVLNGFFLLRQEPAEVNAVSFASEQNMDNEYLLASSSSYEFENYAQQ